MQIETVLLFTLWFVCLQDKKKWPFYPMYRKQTQRIKGNEVTRRKKTKEYSKLEMKEGLLQLIPQICKGLKISMKNCMPTKWTTRKNKFLEACNLQDWIMNRKSA